MMFMGTVHPTEQGCGCRTPESGPAQSSRWLSRTFSSGGRAIDEALVAVATAAIPSGSPLLEVVGQQRATVSETSTLQSYADELLARGQAPTQTWRFRHNLSTQPGLSAFNVGDYAKVRVQSDPYFATGEYGMRLLSRSGDARGRTVDLVFQPSGSFTPAGA